MSNPFLEPETKIPLSSVVVAIVGAFLFALILGLVIGQNL